jgi:hypothetical protein
MAQAPKEISETFQSVLPSFRYFTFSTRDDGNQGDYAF